MANATLITWLNNAYSLEQSAIKMLEGHAADYAEMPELQKEVEKHIEETREHARMVKERIEALDGNVSEVKGFVGALSGAMQGFSTEFFKDEITKNAIADYVAEHLEIASYTAIAAAADELGDSETATMAKTILKEEQKAADTLAKHLPDVVRHLLMKS